MYSFTSDSLDLSIPDPSAAIAASPFFTKLPLELRRRIYIFAFGGRTVHIDLRFSGPDLVGTRQAGIDADASQERPRCRDAFSTLSGST